MNYFFSILILCLSASNIKAQSSEDSIKAVIDKMFSALKNADAAGLIACFADSAILQTISNNKQGKTIISTDPLHEFADFVSKQKAGAADERIEYGSIKIDGQLAIAWTPYKFYYNGQFSHCGVNSFQLVKINEAWKIQYLIDTRRKQGCN